MSTEEDKLIAAIVMSGFQLCPVYRGNWKSPFPRDLGDMMGMPAIAPETTKKELMHYDVYTPAGGYIGRRYTRYNAALLAEAFIYGWPFEARERVGLALNATLGGADERFARPAKDDPSEK